MASGMSARAPERLEIERFQLCAGRLHDRQGFVAVGAGAAVAGHVLDHRQHAAGEQPFRRGPPERGHAGRAPAVGAVADDVVGAGHRHVETGRQSTLMPTAGGRAAMRRAPEPRHLALRHRDRQGRPL
jgi:hypothetical protein